MRDEDAASSAARSCMRLELSPCAEQRILPPGSGCRACGAAGRGPGCRTVTGVRRRRLPRPARAPTVSWAPRCPRLPESRRDGTQLPGNVTGPAGRLRHPSPPPRLRQKRQSHERRSVGTCHHVSSFGCGRNREEPGRAIRGESAKAPHPPLTLREMGQIMSLRQHGRPCANASFITHLSHAQTPRRSPREVLAAVPLRRRGAAPRARALCSRNRRWAGIQTGPLPPETPR